jgi:hypothetical protein
MGRNESPARMREEGFSIRDAGRTLAESLSAVAVTLALVGWIGPLGLLAFPLSVWLFWRGMQRQSEHAEKVAWLPADPPSQWLEDAYASRRRGTGITTLAVRYGVDPQWLEAQLAERERE